jgi:hypothetical protein
MILLTGENLEHFVLVQLAGFVDKSALKEVKPRKFTIVHGNQIGFLFGGKLNAKHIFNFFRLLVSPASSGHLKMIASF